MKVRYSAQVVLVGAEALGRLAFCTLDLSLLQPRRDCAHDACGHLVLQIEDVVKCTLETICPEMHSGRCIDELRRDSHPVCCLAHAAFEHVAHPELATNLFHVHRPALVGKARIARDHEQPMYARQGRGDLFHHAVSEVVLFRVAAHVIEGHDGDRWFVGQRQCSLCCSHIQSHAIHPHRPRDVLELPVAYILEGDIDLPLHVFLHATRYADSTRLRQPLQTCRHVHAVAVNVSAIDNDVTDIDAHAELDPLVLWLGAVALDHFRLYLDGAAYRVHNACELHQHSVADNLNDAPAVFLDFWIDQVLPICLQPDERALVVAAHQSAIAGDVRREYCRKPSLHVLGGHSDRLTYRGDGELYGGRSSVSIEATMQAWGQSRRPDGLRDVSASPRLPTN